MNKKPIFIAEIKTQSMFGFRAKYSREHLIDTALRYGDWVSVHTDPRFGGSFDDIYQIRQKTNKPILAKGFHTHNDDIKKALDLGANFVLVVDRFIDVPLMYVNKCLFEFSNFSEAEKYKNWVSLGFVYNGRNLNTGIGKKYIGDYQKYRESFKWLCGASLLQEYEDVQRFYPNCDAFIVGSNLIEFCKTIKD